MLNSFQRDQRLFQKTISYCQFYKQRLKVLRQRRMRAVQKNLRTKIIEGPKVQQYLDIIFQGKIKNLDTSKCEKKLNKFYAIIQSKNQLNLDLGGLYIIKENTNIIGDDYRNKNFTGELKQQPYSSDQESSQSDNEYFKERKIFASQNGNQIYFEVLHKVKLINDNKQSDDESEDSYYSLDQYGDDYDQYQQFNQYFQQYEDHISDNKFITFAKLGSQKLVKQKLLNLTVDDIIKTNIYKLQIDVERQIKAIKSVSSELSKSNLRHIMFPNKFHTLKNYQDDEVDIQLDQQLNKYHQQALLNIQNHHFTLIKTPPGSGKDSLINEICAQYVRKGKKILINAPTNYAVDQTAVNVYQKVTQNIVRVQSSNQLQFNEVEVIGKIAQEISSKQKIIKKIFKKQFNLLNFKNTFPRQHHEIEFELRKKLNQRQRQQDGQFIFKKFKYLYEYTYRTRLRYIVSLSLSGNQYFAFEKNFLDIEYLYENSNLKNRKRRAHDLINYLRRNYVEEIFTQKLFKDLVGKDLDLVQNGENFVQYKRIYYFSIFLPRFQEWLFMNEKNPFIYLKIKQVYYSKQKLQNILDQIIEQSDVVLCTCIKSGWKRIKKTFDIIIVQQSAQASQIWTLVSLTTSRSQKIILLGDQRQLQPGYQQQFQKQAKLTDSLFTRLINNGHDFIILKEQYQINPRIADFFNKYFYQNTLIQSKDLQKINKTIPENFGSIQWRQAVIIEDSYDKKYNEKEIKEGNSYQNKKQAYIIQDLVDQIPKQQLRNVGIITGYRAQEIFLKQILQDEEKLHGLDIRTIDGYEGKLKDYIIISLVRYNNWGELGFLRDQKRINTCMTRARKGIILVCNTNTIFKSNKNDIWQDFVEQFE